MVGVKLDNVAKKFGDAVAVRGVTLEIRRGELFFLLGPSGCGKTTVLRMIAGFCEPDGGEILFDDRPVKDVPPNRRNTGLVFQNYALWPHMTVAQNVAYGLDERRVPTAEKKERVTRAMKAVHIDAYADRSPNQLSGGQQQRVALARALVIEPDIVLLDEPLSNLDARLRLEMRDEIRRIHDETGMTMLYVTHDQKEALSMADRIAVMGMGCVEQVGAPRELYRSPANLFVARFIGEANVFDGTVSRTEDGLAVVATPQGEFRARRDNRSLAPGQKVHCVVRPESMNLRGRTGNVFKATVVRNVYLGETEEYILQVGGFLLKALTANPVEGIRAGEELDVSFRPEDAVALQAETGLPK